MRRTDLTVLGALTALGSLGTHMVVPALPIMAHDLATDASTMQMAVSIYLLGLGFGQLSGGIASDTLGRVVVLRAGVVTFAAGAALAGLTTRIEPFLVARLIQALGGSAALVACRAIVTEQSRENEVVGGLATLLSIGLLSPAVAPTIGGALTAVAGWRAVFALLAAAAIIGLAGTRRFLDGPSHATPRPRLWAAWATLLGDRPFLLWVAGNGLVSAAFFSFLA